MRIIVFGTYEKWRYPRVRVLIEGFRELGDEIIECNVPLGLDTEARMDLIRRPWRGAAFALRVLRAWRDLRSRARAMPQPDAVLVPYMGHFDVHLARALWPHTVIVLDHLISAAGTAADRGIARPPVRRALQAVDNAALQRADLAVFDTDANRMQLAGRHAARGMVVPVGAPAAFFPREGQGAESPRARGATTRMRAGFFGIYTPLHGTAVIAEAIATLAAEPIDFVMVGNGQQRADAQRVAAVNPNVTWIDWVALDDFPDVLRGWDVCLGIFATTAKAMNVVPHKVFLGAASGCAIVTSDTAPQRAALGDAAVHVPPGDSHALAAALRQLARDPDRLRELQRAAGARARSAFSPRAVVAPLRARLAGMT